MVIYRRKLPHIQPFNGCFFVTFMVKGALPKQKIQQLNGLRKAIADNDQEALANVPFPNIRQVPWDQYMESFNKLLDDPSSSPRWLEQAPIANEIVKSIQFLGESKMRVLAWCIMPNHVHLLVDQLSLPLHVLLQRLKRHTARQCNILLNRTGQKFWQEESFDYLLRKEEKVVEKANYILQNPVRAGLTSHRNDWKYAGLHPDLVELFDELGI